MAQGISLEKLGANRKWACRKMSEAGAGGDALLRRLNSKLLLAVDAFCGRPGEQIITQGETGATFYIMFSGTVDVYKDLQSFLNLALLWLPSCADVESSVFPHECQDDMKITTLEVQLAGLADVTDLWKMRAY